MRRVIAVSLVAVTLSLAAMSVAASAETSTLTVMQNWPKGFGDRTPEYEDQFWARAEKELGFKINMVYAPSHPDYVDKLPVMVASGTAPDVVLYAEQAHWALGLFEPLTLFIAKSRFPIRDFLPAAVEAWSSEGQLYAIPTSRNHNLVVYDVDAFAAAGIPNPPTTWADRTWNWDYVRQMARKLTRSEGERVTRYGMQGFGSAEVWPHYWGGDWVDENLNLVVNSERNQQALQFFVDFAREQRLGGDVTKGTAAMDIGASWGVNGYVSSGRNLAFAPTPMGSQAVTIAYVDGAAILRSSKNKDLAWKFMEWFFKPDNAVGFYSVQWNYLIPMRGVLKPWLAQMTKRIGDAAISTHYADVLYEAGAYGVRSKLLTDLKFSPLWSNLRVWNDTNVLFGASHRKMMAGELPVATYLTEGQRLLANMLAQAENKR